MSVGASNPALHNAHLDGQPFVLEGGPVGVLLVHGFTMTPAEVRGFAKRLHDEGYTVAGPLLAGHGTVPEDLNHIKWQDWAQTGEHAYRDLAARCERVFVGGQSTGALVAMSVAQAHPEVAGLLLYAPAIKLALKPVERMLVHLLAPFAYMRPKPGVEEDDVGQCYRVDPVRGVRELLRFQGPVRDALPKIHQPVLVVQGRLDATLDPTAAEIVIGGVSSEHKEMHWMERSVHTVLLGPELDECTDTAVRFIEGALS